MLFNIRCLKDAGIDRVTSDEQKEHKYNLFYVDGPEVILIGFVQLHLFTDMFLSMIGDE